MRRQYGQIPKELVALNVYIHTLAQQGASDIPSGELMIMGIDQVVVGRESLFTNRDVTYDPVAPVSKRTKAVVPQTKNLPITTSGASAASSSVRWFNLPRPAAGGGAA
jgi:hypothetical protein